MCVQFKKQINNSDNDSDRDRDSDNITVTITGREGKTSVYGENATIWLLLFNLSFTSNFVFLVDFYNGRS